jgi:hypothetical protein
MYREYDLRSDDISGMTVHIAARTQALAVTRGRHQCRRGAGLFAGRIARGSHQSAGQRRARPTLRTVRGPRLPRSAAVASRPVRRILCGDLAAPWLGAGNAV